MKFIKYIILGTFFGIVLSKAEIISWFRIYEMFHFQSFHMFGVIGSAVIIGAIMVAIIKKVGIKDNQGTPIQFTPKQMSPVRYLIGGSIFGIGWAMTGACPGPMFTLVGNGSFVILVVILSSVLGTFAYGVLRDKLPH